MMTRLEDVDEIFGTNHQIELHTWVWTPYKSNCVLPTLPTVLRRGRSDYTSGDSNVRNK